MSVGKQAELAQHALALKICGFLLAYLQTKPRKGAIERHPNEATGKGAFLGLRRLSAGSSGHLQHTCVFFVHGSDPAARLICSQMGVGQNERTRVTQVSVFKSSCQGAMLVHVFEPFPYLPIKNNRGRGGQRGTADSKPRLAARRYRPTAVHLGQAYVCWPTVV